jgi:hypothetical protein
MAVFYAPARRDGGRGIFVRAALAPVVQVGVKPFEAAQSLVVADFSLQHLHRNPPAYFRMTSPRAYGCARAPPSQLALHRRGSRCPPLGLDDAL